MPQIKKDIQTKINMEIKDTYKTIAAPSEGEYKEKGSKFIGLAFEVEDEEEIKYHLEEVKKEHFKARHHCYAWRLGQGKDNYRANDDGEPSSTAGRPILGQIDSFGLTNLLIIVVRYYGGTKLGTSGLKNAYKTAAKAALEIATIEEKIIKTKFKLTIDYPQLSDVMNYLNQEDIEILDSEYTNTQVFMRLRIRNSLIEMLETEAKENWSNSKLEEIL
jgi:uncharacterized YigZ family protein